MHSLPTPHPTRRLTRLPALPHPAATTTDWQHSLGASGGMMTATAAAKQQQQQQAAQPFPGCSPAAAAAAAAEPDPWCSGLDLMASHSSADEGLPLLDLTDAGLDALLAPFEEWPCMLQPPAGPPALHPASPVQQPFPPAAPAPSSSLQQAAAASPRCSSGTSPGSAAAEPASGGACGKAPRRKGGRPRIHHPRTSPASAAGAAAAGAAAAAGSGAAGGSAAAIQHFKQGGRGPKPKYVFATQVRDDCLFGLQWDEVRGLLAGLSGSWSRGHPVPTRTASSPAAERVAAGSRYPQSACCVVHCCLPAHLPACSPASLLTCLTAHLPACPLA